MMIVELVYESTCPNVKAARVRLLEAFKLAGIPPNWREWEIGRPETPENVQNLGSPSILVDGKDVSESNDRAEGNSCRLYTTRTGYDIAPAVSQIAGALCAAESDGHGSFVSKSAGFATLPSILVALLPKLTCPVCWPAYTAILSAVGVNFVNYTPVLLPVLVILLLVALFSLAYHARQRRGFGPFWLGFIASLIILVGKFLLEIDSTIYLGSGLLVVASLWNIWPRKIKPLVDSQST